MVYSDMTLFALLTGVIVPLLVGLLTKLNAASWIKSTLNLGLVAVGTALATVNEIDFEWRVFLVNFGIGWAVSVATYYGFYKPANITPTIQEATADVGLG